MVVDIKMLRLIESKQALVNVITEDMGYIHASAVVKGDNNTNKVLSFEYIPVNYPQWSFLVFDSLKEYYDAIKDVDWIMDELKPEVKKRFQEV